MIYRPEAGPSFWSLAISLLIAPLPLALLSWIAVIMIDAIFVIIITGLYTTAEYILTDDRLIVKAFGIKQNAEYRAITSIVETKRYGFSGLAFKREKIEIIFNNKRAITYITPKNKDEFLRILRSRAPQAVYRNELVSNKI